MLSETLSTGDSEPSLSAPSLATQQAPVLPPHVSIARLTLQLRASLQEAADAEAIVAGANEETARAELRARLDPLMAERRAVLEEALRVAREEAAAHVSNAHREAAALLAPAPAVTDLMTDQQSGAHQELQAQIDATLARAAAARERTLIKEAAVQVALNEELTIGRDALAAIEHEHALAIAEVRRAAQLEVEQILATDPQGNVDDAR
ncbi:MAG: hypothetical protein K8R99_02020 [Actinomycetia bacterium]|nr:hypothetical protein [Actinomycetes bacterium]